MLLNGGDGSPRNRKDVDVRPGVSGPREGTPLAAFRPQMLRGAVSWCSFVHTEPGPGVDCGGEPGPPPSPIFESLRATKTPRPCRLISGDPAGYVNGGWLLVSRGEMFRVPTEGGRQAISDAVHINLTWRSWVLPPAGFVPAVDGDGR